MRFKYLLPLALLLPLTASAVDLTWSGFATLGYAQSDQPYKYQRFIDDQGSFNRDSISAPNLISSSTSNGAPPCKASSPLR